MRTIDLNEEIIVFVVYKGIKQWYISDKEIWFLDKQKNINMYRDLGYEIKDEYIDERRRDVLILDTENMDVFLTRVKEDVVETPQLREILIEVINDKETWVYNYMPSLYIDFDKKELFSMYLEPASYEDYVPPEWRGCFENFIKLIPREYCYWKDIIRLEH